MYSISFLPQKITIQVPEGTTVLEAERMAGLEPDAPCGGRGVCGKCNVVVEAGESKETISACQTKIDRDMVVDTGRTEQEHKILTEGVCRSVEVAPLVAEAAEGCLMAFDIGTTTIAGYLMEGRSGKQLAIVSAMNPQFQFGADVIARANYVLENDGVRMQEVVQDALNVLIAEAAGKAGVDPASIRLIAIAGNTCMHHLFLGISPRSLVIAPYVAQVTDGMILDAAQCHLKIHPEGKVLMLPNIAGFVGADTAACMLAVDFAHLKPMTLMIDIGTNGELVMGNQERLVTCSTAAGPAFEGAKIGCGMRGAKGAISHVHMEGTELKMEIIDAEQAEGICGSGLIDVIALLIKYGFIDCRGGFADPEELESEAARANSWRLQRRDDRPVFLLQEADALSGRKEILISQRDVREVQLAKGAIAAGIQMLKKTLSIETEQIDQVLLAGAFGNYMNTDSACEIGLIPEELRGRIRGIGNAAGEGAKLAVLNGALYREICEVAKTVESVELAMKPEFQDMFVDELEFANAEER